MKRYVFPAIALFVIGGLYFFFAAADFRIHQDAMENRRFLGCLDIEECRYYPTPVYLNLGTEKAVIGALFSSGGIAALILNKYHPKLHTTYGRH